MPNNVVTIRKATHDDATKIADLSKQLGYPNSEEVIKERLQAILNASDHIVYVASVPDTGTIAWIHIYKAQSLQSGPCAEISGFIVSEEFRGKGLGKNLLEAAGQWARQKKLPRLRVRSQIKREETRKFYSNRGFSVTKQQRVFDKKIKPASRDDFRNNKET